MKFRLPTASPHVLMIAGLTCIVAFINASGLERPLGMLDRDLHASLRGDYPDLLRGLDLRQPERMPILNLSAMHLAGEDMRALSMSYNTLRDLDLRGSHLEASHFQCVSMDRVNLSGADLKGAKFDYANCGGDADPKHAKDYTLTINLNGADLSSAVLEGNQYVEDGQKGECGRRLKIVGNLNGARFTGATLRCVILVNEEKGDTISSKAKIYSLPRYAGINFVDSKGSTLYLQQGNFRFSDFYKANLDLMQFSPDRADLSFSTLAQLQCQNAPDGCRIMQIEDGNFSASGASRSSQKLSLNLRGSRVTSNLPLPDSRGWPAILCNQESVWQMAKPKASKLSNADMGHRLPLQNSGECVGVEFKQRQQNSR